MGSTAITTEAIRQARADLARPIAQAEGLPGLFYGEAFYALEQERLFPRGWCAVTVGAAIPNAGDIVPIDVAGWPIIVLRDRDGAIRAFHNICRHRALRLVGEARCAARMIRCPWHAWTYDLTGRLLATPEIGGPRQHEAAGFTTEELGLKPIRIGQWLDYIFVNLDGAARDFATHVAGLQDLVANLDLGGLRHGGRIDEAYRGNWKVSTESGIEDYHLVFGHPQLDAHLFRNSRFCGADGVFTGGIVAMQADAAGLGALPPLTTCDGTSWPGMIVLSVFPTGTVLITPDHVMLGMLLPDGPARTRVELHLYFKNTPDWDAHQAGRDGALAMWREVLPQDFQFIEGTQATLAMRDAAGIRTRFSPYWEQAVRHFQQMVLDAVD